MRCRNGANPQSKRYFLPMAPPRLQELYDSSSLARKIRSKYPKLEEMPRRLKAWDEDALDADTAPPCILSHSFYDGSYWCKVVIVNNDGRESVIEDTLDNLVRLMEPSQIARCHPVRRGKQH